MTFAGSRRVDLSVSRQTTGEDRFADERERDAVLKSHEVDGPLARSLLPGLIENDWSTIGFLGDLGST